MKKSRLKKVNNWIFVITFILMVINVVEMIVFKSHDYDAALFRMFQYVCMILVLKAPDILKHRFKMEVPLVLSVVIAWFSFNALVLGDGLDFYGKYPWWDSFLHFHSGIILSFVALWIVYFLMKEKSKYFYLNRVFVSLFIISFSLGIGAFWEICEFTADDLFNLNTQQYMKTTESSLVSKEDVPLQGHDALKDTMKDLILDLGGAVLVSIYGYIRHDQLLIKYKIKVKDELFSQQVDN